MKKRNSRKKAQSVSAVTATLLFLFACTFFLFSEPKKANGDGAGIGDNVSGKIVKAPKPEPEKPDSFNPMSGIMLHSTWEWELERDGRTVDTWVEKNIVTTEGISAMLDVMFNGASQKSTWYVLIYENSFTPVIGDTYADPDFSECTAYAGPTRPEAVFAEASGATSVTNSANKASFSINDTKTIYGAALVSSGVSGDATSGETLFNLSNFSSSKSVENGDTLNVTITLSMDDT